MRGINKKGAILVEATIVLFNVALVIFLHFELIRRSYFEVLMHYGAFTMVRLRAFGYSKESSNNIVKNIFIKAFDEKRGLKFYSKIKRSEELVSRGLEAKFWVRYPTLLRFPYKNQTKHHFEITRKCIYPL